jgi:hypothetical protein
MTSLRVGILSCALLAGIAASSGATPNQAAAATLCPEIFMPVCAVNPAGTRQTYTNSCFAHVAHARVLHPGRCIGPICFFHVSPVCAINPKTHKRQTYPNLCAAENADAMLVHDGACP